MKVLTIDKFNKLTKRPISRAIKSDSEESFIKNATKALFDIYTKNKNANLWKYYTKEGNIFVKLVHSKDENFHFIFDNGYRFTSSTYKDK